MTRFLAFSATFLVFVQSAYGGLIPRHDPTIVANGLVAQDGFNLSFDPATGLEWLDATLTNYRPISVIRAELSAGGDYDGFRFATRDEAAALADHLGLSSPPHDDQTMAAAISLVGDTWGPNAELGQLGGFVLVLDEPRSDFTYWAVAVVDYDGTGVGVDTAGLAGLSIHVLEGSHGPVSYALVRAAPVPEPAARVLAAVSTGVVIAAFARRRMRTRGTA